MPEEGALHILTRGNNRQQIFKDESDYKTYLNFLKRYKQENNIMMYHYCLMPNHVHLIVGINRKSNIARFMKQVNLTYLYHYRRRYSYCGHLWQGRYKSLIISEDEYLIACGRYVELNPLKARLVKEPGEYKWSSYNVYSHGIRDGIVDYDPVYLGYGEREKDRQRMYQEDIDEGIMDANFGRRFLGTDEFVKKMEEKYGINNVCAKRGRPKKANN